MKVSICTPTYNRRFYIKKLMNYIKTQDYPIEDIEWLIYDDGTDKIKDVIEGFNIVKYYQSKEKKTIGYKRNFLNGKVIGEIIVNMDDDDIYPQDRISHAVKVLQENKDIDIVGSSIVNIFYNNTKKIYQFGPYMKNHATANTFAYKRRILKKTKYNETLKFGEEKSFLKNYTIPMKQLDTYSTVLMIAHEKNTVNKDKFVSQGREMKKDIIYNYKLDITEKLFE